MPDAVRDADAVVLFVLDGLGWDQLQEHATLAPTLMSMQGRSIHTVAPTTTATALSSITTGLTPGEHGLIGYRMVLGGEVVNVLRWAVGTQQVRRSQPPSSVQPFEPFLGQRVPVVAQGELQESGFSEAHLRGSDPVGWRSPSSIAVEAAAQVRAGERFVYCYYNGVDKIAHERGFGDYYDAELRFADALVADLIAAVPAGNRGARHRRPRTGARRGSHRASVRGVAGSGHDAVGRGSVSMVALCAERHRRFDRRRRQRSR